MRELTEAVHLLLNAYRVEGESNRIGLGSINRLLPPYFTELEPIFRRTLG